MNELRGKKNMIIFSPPQRDAFAKEFNLDFEIQVYTHI